MYGNYELSLKCKPDVWFKRLKLISNYGKKLKSLPISSILVYENFEIAVSINYKSNCMLHSEQNLMIQALFYFTKSLINISNLYVNLKPCGTCSFLMTRLGVKSLIFFSSKKNLCKKSTIKNLTNNNIINFLRH